MSGTIADFKKESWGVHPVLAMPEHFPPAVMFCILSADPRSKYRDVLKRMSEKRPPPELHPPPFVTPELMQQSRLSVAWDAVFHDVPGDRIGLLYRNEGRQTSTESADKDRKTLSSVHSVMIRSTEPAGPKWLVTRAVQFRERAVCWCISADVEKGKNTEIKLTVQNMIPLETI